MTDIIERRGRRVVIRANGEEVRAYAPGDGHLSFVASYNGNASGCAIVTEIEARAICPYGWVVYMQGPNPRARPAK